MMSEKFCISKISLAFWRGDRLPPRDAILEQSHLLWVVEVERRAKVMAFVPKLQIQSPHCVCVLPME